MTKSYDRNMLCKKFFQYNPIPFPPEKECRNTWLKYQHDNINGISVRSHDNVLHDNEVTNKSHDDESKSSHNLGRSYYGTLYSLLWSSLLNAINVWLVGGKSCYLLAIYLLCWQVMRIVFFKVRNGGWTNCCFQFKADSGYACHCL